MINPYTRFKFKRFLRRSRSTPVRIAKFFNDNVFASSKKHAKIRKFSLMWLAVVFVIFGATATQALLERRTILVSVPSNGGTHREAVVGDLDNFNPLFAVDGANADVSRLLFAGLVEYSPEGELIGELAESWESNDSADTFTVKLKPNLSWHDGSKLTAEDIAFTINLIQNPDTRSPLKETWRGIQVQVIDELTVTFKLPNPFAPFPQLLTVGILPQHIVKDIDPANLRISNFAVSPVGSGVFELQEFDTAQNRIIMTAFDNYAQGEARLSRLIIRGYTTIDDARDALKQKLVDGLGSVDRLEGYSEEDGYQNSEPKLAIGNYMLFNSSKSLFSDAKLRKALTKAVNVSTLQQNVESPKPELRSVFLPSQLRATDPVNQLSFDASQAAKDLSAIGWKSANGTRNKDGRMLQFDLAVADRESTVAIAERIKEQLGAVGVIVTIQKTPVEDYQTDVVLPHKYDALLVSLTNGIDPDVFVFWHSSQAQPGGLNFSEIEDEELDSALEAGRTRTDRELREAKYKAFAERWQKLAPGVAINQEQYHYVRRNRAKGPLPKVFLQPKDRFNTVEKWTVLFNNVERKNL